MFHVFLCLSFITLRENGVNRGSTRKEGQRTCRAKAQAQMGTIALGLKIGLGKGGRDAVPRLDVRIRHLCGKMNNEALDVIIWYKGWNRYHTN